MAKSYRKVAARRRRSYVRVRIPAHLVPVLCAWYAFDKWHEWGTDLCPETFYRRMQIAQLMMSRCMADGLSGFLGCLCAN